MRTGSPARLTSMSHESGPVSAVNCVPPPHLAARRMLGEQLIKRILEGAAAMLGLQPGVEVHECDYRVLAA